MMDKLTKQNTILITVDPNFSGQRLDNFLIRHLKGVPKSFIYKIVRKGAVRVNTKRIKPDYRLEADDIIKVPTIRVATETEEPIFHKVSWLEGCILYEDKGLIVINKPSGIAVHGGSGINFGVIETIRQMRPEEKHLELVHRLDRDTSGCLMIAKKSSVLRRLHELLRVGQVEKTYLALVEGHWSKKIQEVDAPLHKNHLSSGERIVTVDDEGKPSVTKFRVVQYFANTTLIEAKPLTGRTHQIRVHAAHAGHAIVGDEKYGDKVFNKMMREQGCKRLFLHAAHLAFTLPDSNAPLNFDAELGSELTAVLKKLAV